MSGPLSVLVVGGGPAGLYAAQLFKRTCPQRTVRLFERNARDVATGWGVVFPASAVGWLRATDPATAAALETRLIHWDELEVSFRGKVVRAAGHSYWAIRRSALLQILRTGCERAGVDLLYNREYDNEAALRHHDLVVAADGLRSRVRNAHRRAFKPELTSCRNKYIWLGTPRLFDRFTFIFRDSPYGPFWAYAYRFDNQLSTFNIECSEHTWTRAGLHRAIEKDSISLCEKIFADDLGGAPLLANRSEWMSFRTVRNRTWQDGNVVLVGDAAHTTHFTVGSGTKLAMEDSAALVTAVNDQRDMPSALAQYVARRMPQAERMQAAASESMTWFENLGHHMRLPPEQFAATLLMRSNEVSFERLKKRDPEFVRRAVAAFVGSAGENALGDAPPLAVPFPLRSLCLAGRVVAAAPSAALSSPGWPDANALGRVSLIIADDARLPALAECARIWRRLAALMRCRGIHLAIQLRDGMDPPSVPVVEVAHEAGVDAIELIIEPPFRPGPLAAVRSIWPATKPLLVRASIERCSEPDAVELGNKLIDVGCDALVIPPARRPGAGGCAVLSEAVRNLTGLPTIATGIATADEANTLLLAGQADLCMLLGQADGQPRLQGGWFGCSMRMS